MPSTIEMQQHQRSVVSMRNRSATTTNAAHHNHPNRFVDPTGAIDVHHNKHETQSHSRVTVTTNSSSIVRDPREGQYVFGKRIQRARASTFKGTGHALQVKVATDADFIPAPSSFVKATESTTAGRSVRPRSGTFGPPPQTFDGAIRPTAVNRDAVKRANELQPADLERCTELTAPVYSSFRVSHTAVSRCGSFGRPSSHAFKPYVGDAKLKLVEPTEFTTSVRSSIDDSLARAPSMSGTVLRRTPSAGASMRRDRSFVSATESLSRTGGGGYGRSSLEATTTDRTSGWLPKDKEVPGPGQYFIP